MAKAWPGRFNASPKMCCWWTTGRSTRRCKGWKPRAGLMPSGALPPTIAARAFISSPGRAGSSWRRKPVSGENWPRRLAAFWAPRRVKDMWWKRKRQDFQAEIDAHLQLEADELRSEGVHSEDAHAAAQRALGNRAAIEERFYESTPWMPFEHALRDLKYAARVLRKDAAFTALAIAVLALSIGGNTAIFSLVNAMLLRPLKIQNPEQIVGCYSVDAHPPGFSRGFSYTNYIDLRENNPVFTSVAAHGVASVGVGTAEGGTTHRVGADIVSSNYFATLGVPLFKGRPFTTDEERPDSGAPVVILSYSYWKKTGADPEAVGKPLRINGRTFSVV